MIKNPKWTRDELILALDFYFSHYPLKIGSNNKELIELSQLLRSLPIHNNAVKNPNFRNPNGVYLKLCNFQSIDPEDSNKGMSAIGKLDKIIWDEFASKRKDLALTAKTIKEGIQILNKAEKFFSVDEEFNEGQIVTKLHKYRERNTAVVRKKKELFKQQHGRLYCEICHFDFEQVYKNFGADYIECHHLKPVSEYEQNEKTKLSDLILVCANCHRMLHRNNKGLTPDNLKNILQN